jgi:hypothetical protein
MSEFSDPMKQEIWNRYSIVDKNGNTLMTPLVVSKERKTVYLHIAKTGGSSITRDLQSNGFDDGVLTGRQVPIQDKRAYFKELLDTWDDYFKFTFVRNKYDQLVSLYHYDRNAGHVRNKTFDEFVCDVVANSEDEYGYWIDQYFLTTHNGVNFFDVIGTTATHDKDWRDICQRLGITHRNTTVNVGTYNKDVPTSSFYSQRSIDIVNEKFADEIEHYGWELK